MLHIYQHEAPLYELDRVRTPTLISTGEEDVRVPPSQSYMLERALYYRGVSVKLITIIILDFLVLKSSFTPF